MSKIERLYIIFSTLFFVSVALNIALFNGVLTRREWVIPSDSIVVSKDFITLATEHSEGKK